MKNEIDNRNAEAVYGLSELSDAMRRQVPRIAVHGEQARFVYRQYRLTWHAILVSIAISVVTAVAVKLAMMHFDIEISVWIESFTFAFLVAFVTAYRRKKIFDQNCMLYRIVKHDLSANGVKEPYIELELRKSGATP